VDESYPLPKSLEDLMHFRWVPVGRKRARMGRFAIIQ
jgi:hypothetical protein